MPFATATLLLTACGGSSPTHVSSAPIQAARAVPPIPHFVGADPVKSGGAHTVRARPPQEGTDDDEVNSSGAKTLNPCALVSRSEAQAILHRLVARTVDAPQGPTCIYETQGAAGYVTLAMQSMGFSKVAPQAQLRNRHALTVGGHAAYCGTAGGAQMVIPLSNGQFLTVAAPCDVASQFAAKALSRVAG